MKRNESGVTEVFVAELRERASERGIDFVQYPLGPQDRNVLSDTLFSNNFDHFSLVEMKFSDIELASECHKRDRVSALCQALEKNARMRKFHDQCHLIAWKDSTSGELKTSPYRHQICNRDVLGSSCNLRSRAPDNTWTVDITKFADDFFGDPAKRCLGKADFKKYVAWLLGVVTDSKVKQLEVIARGRNAENRPIATTVSLDQICDELAIRAKSHNASASEQLEQSAGNKKLVANLLLNGE